MPANVRATELEVRDDFSVEIWWAGEQDKPFYRATLVSAPDRAIGWEPFCGVAVISREELGRLLRALDRHQVRLSSQPAAGMAEEYRIEVLSDGSRMGGALGAGERAREVLAAMCDALDEEHRAPLRDILRRLAPTPTPLRPEACR